MTVDNIAQNPLLKKILPNGIEELIWKVSENINEGNPTVASVLLEGGFHGQVHASVKGKDDKLIVQDRVSGKLVEEKIPSYIKIAMRMMYHTREGKFAVDKLQLAKVLKHLTEQQGKKYTNPHSVKEITSFIAFHNLNKEEILDPLDSFKNFNEFFYRKLKKTAREIASSADPKVAVSPADCRLNVFPTIDDATKIWIKGKNFTLKNLIKDDALANQYVGGSLAICRLAPQDYHRFHIPCNGTLGKFVPIDGTYYTVNPIAVREQVDVYTENKRQRVVISSPEFGDVLYISVGATMVGSIFYTAKEGQPVQKGDELGYFAFGGSTVLLLFKKGTIKFDNDLVVNSTKPIESLVKMGMSLGKSTK